MKVDDTDKWESRVVKKVKSKSECVTYIIKQEHFGLMIFSPSEHRLTEVFYGLSFSLSVYFQPVTRRTNQNQTLMPKPPTFNTGGNTQENNTLK